MKRIWYLWLLFIFVSGLSAEELPRFGNQITLPDTKISSAIITKKILGNTKYRVTPGDTYALIVTLKETQKTSLILSNSYILEIPYLGSFNVKGMYYDELRDKVIKQIKSMMTVQYVEFVLESPAVFDVFVYGGVKNPGFVSAMPINAVTDAIAQANGLVSGGSHRQVQLLRGEEVISLDLARYVGEADLTQNPLLQPGDKIFVPKVSVVSQIEGSVAFPDVYELLEGETISDLIKYAGGFLPLSVPGEIEVVRVSNASEILSVDLDTMGDFPIEHGDIVRVPSVSEKNPMLLVEGALFGKPKDAGPQKIPTKPVVFNAPFIPGMTLLQLIRTYGGPTPLAEGEKSFVIRKETGVKIPVDVTALWETENPALDLELMPGDHIYIPFKNLNVIVGGEVNNPGAFPYQTGTTVMDYLLLAGGINPEKGSLKRIYEITRTGETVLIDPEDEVKPGQTIFARKNSWRETTWTLDQVAIVITFLSSVVILADNVFELSSSLR